MKLTNKLSGTFKPKKSILERYNSKKYIKNSRKEKLKKISVIGSEVLLPFEEEGLVIDYVNWRLDWYPFKVEITKGSCFNQTGDIVEFKREDIIFKDKVLNKLF